MNKFQQSNKILHKKPIDKGISQDNKHFKKERLKKAPRAENQAKRRKFMLKPFQLWYCKNAAQNLIHYTLFYNIKKFF